MATSARPVAPSKRRGEGQGRTAPQTFDISKVSARGLSFGVPSSGSPGAASFSGSSALRVLLERLASAERQLCSHSVMIQSPRDGARKQRKIDSPARPDAPPRGPSIPAFGQAPPSPASPSS